LSFYHPHFNHARCTDIARQCLPLGFLCHRYFVVGNVLFPITWAQITAFAEWKQSLIWAAPNPELNSRL